MPESLTPLTDGINALTAYANTVTGESDTTLSDAVASLAEGYGGGGSATLIEKNIGANGTYNASSDNADGYSKVVVAVPNSYSAGDEGKVVSNGALVSQTAHAEVTQNGTIDTTLNNSVTVNVSGGGGGASLPSIISKIDGGSFTPASDTATGSYSISHNLGTAPTGVAIWATNMTKEAYSVRTVDMLQLTSTEYALLQVNTNGTDRVVNGTLGSGDLGSSSFKFTLASNYYKAGVTYHWLAWA